MFYPYASVHDRLKGIHAPANGVMPGLFRAQPTGNVADENTQYIEVVIAGVHRWARPCYAFGGLCAIPSREWLELHKDLLVLWVLFEEQNPAKPVWIGWSYRDSSATGASFLRTWLHQTEVFTTEIDDKAERYVRRAKSFNETIEKDAYTLTTEKRVYIGGGDSATLISDRTTQVEGKEVVLGDESRATNAGVLGAELNQNLTALTNQLAALNQQLAVVAGNLGVVAGAVGNIGVASAMNATVTQLQSSGVTLNNLITAYAKHLSKKTRLE